MKSLGPSPITVMFSLKGVMLGKSRLRRPTTRHLRRRSRRSPRRFLPALHPLQVADPWMASKQQMAGQLVAVPAPRSVPSKPPIAGKFKEQDSRIVQIHAAGATRSALPRHGRVEKPRPGLPVLEKSCKKAAQRNASVNGSGGSGYPVTGRSIRCLLT